MLPGVVARQPIKEAHLDVLYINGAVEAEASRRNIPWYRYTPAQSKSRISDDTLKAMDWWPRWLRTGGHASDASTRAPVHFDRPLPP